MTYNNSDKNLMDLSCKVETVSFTCVIRTKR